MSADGRNEEAAAIAMMDWRGIPEADRESAVRVMRREAVEINSIGFPTIAAALLAGANVLERTR